MLRFHVRRGRRDAGACASAERVWLFSLRDDLVLCLPLSPSPSRKSATGGGSFCPTSSSFPDTPRPPWPPNTTTIARAYDGQQHGDNATQEAPSTSIQAGRAGGHFYYDVWMVKGTRKGRRLGRNWYVFIFYVLTFSHRSFPSWQLASATTSPRHHPPTANTEVPPPRAPTLARDARRASTNANAPRCIGRLSHRLGTPLAPQRTFTQHTRAPSTRPWPWISQDERGTAYLPLVACSTLFVHPHAYLAPP